MVNSRRSGSPSLRSASSTGTDFTRSNSRQNSSGRKGRKYWLWTMARSDEVPHLVEDAVAHRLQPEERVHDGAQRLEALAEEEEAFLRRVLLHLLVEQGAAGAVVHQLLLHVPAEHHPLVIARVEQPARELDCLPQRIAHVPQLLARSRG